MYWLSLDDLITLQVQVDKENLIKFPLFSVYYLYNYYMVYVLFSHSYHVTTLYDIIYCDCDPWSWLYNIFPHSLPLSSKSKNKKKRNINNDLAVLPSHNTYISYIK